MRQPESKILDPLPVKATSEDDREKASDHKEDEGHMHNKHEVGENRIAHFFHVPTVGSQLNLQRLF